jgi:phospholipid/cholesterol/gamma-HCH transport system ATP-binding protein
MMVMMHNNIVTIENVTFSYNDDKVILDDISMNIERGKITAIMGGSGCGKTTLLRLISGQFEINQGKIFILNQDISTMSTRQMNELRKKIGVLFQFGALFTDMTVYENVSFLLKEHTNLSENIIKKIVAMKLKAVGLFGTQYLYPNELSGGMARRVALARANVLDPMLMMYDEPFTGLDPISLNTTASLIKKVNETLNQTSILVTHDIEVSLKLADYVYFMANGKIVGHGSVNEIINSTNPQIKQFLNGEIIGPVNYEYNSKLDYNTYLNQNS